MALYRYVKMEPVLVYEVGRERLQVEREAGNWRVPWGGIAASVMMVIGGGLLSFSLAPIAAYEMMVAPKLTAPLLSPLAEEPVAGRGGVVLGEESGANVDLTKASTWFLDSKREVGEATGVGKFSLWIPKLGIDGATVKVAGEDLSVSLVHYVGTALPGQPGNTVIFGHSVLPQFYNPKNYMTIFSTLPTLNKGDELVVNYDGVTYRYKVEEIFEVQPKDIQILEQKYSGSYLTLVTCVPPGTYLRRLVVRAKLVLPDEGGL